MFLAMASPVFEAMFYGGLAETARQGCQYGIFKKMSKIATKTPKNATLNCYKKVQKIPLKIPKLREWIHSVTKCIKIAKNEVKKPKMALIKNSIIIFFFTKNVLNKAKVLKDT